MEPDYLPIPEIFVSAMIVPQLDFTIRLCIPGIWGVRGPLLTPGWGCGGQRAPEAKNRVVFGTWFFCPLYCSSGFGTSCFGGLKTLYICIMAVYFV